MPITGAEILLEALKREGVECIFGYPGGVTLPLYDVIYDHPIRHVLVRHEQGATHMAEGYARVSGRPGVVMVTSGPGATNAVTGIVDALANGAREWGADLVVLGSSHRRVLERWIIGSVAEQLLSKIDASLLVVRSQ